MKNSLIILLLGAASINYGLSQDKIQLSFSSQRGIYENSIQLKLTANTKAKIWYTLDGSLPLPEKSQLYDKPLPLTKTTVVRARAYGEDSVMSDLQTHTFLFPSSNLTQTKDLTGWPNPEIFTHFTGKPVRMDYEMDPRIVSDPALKSAILTSFKQLPSISLVMPNEDFWKVTQSNDELAVSLEILYPNPAIKSEQADCGIEGVSHKIQKRSYRLSFKKKYGTGKFESQILRSSAPLNREGAAKKFDQLILRGGTQDCWARRWYPALATYTRDQWYRDSQLAMWGVGVRGTFVHMFVDGIYFGLYNLAERPDEEFMAEYLEGKASDWFSFNHNGTLAGDDTRFKRLNTYWLKQDLSSRSNYDSVATYVDLPRFCDYLILSWICGMGDWPSNNFFGGYNSVKETPLLFWGWDAEVSWHSMDEGNDGAWVHPEFSNGEKGDSFISKLWHALRRNGDFMVLFADRVALHCTGAGALSDAAQRERWKTLNDQISNAIVAESARWGDALQDGTTYTRDVHWTREVQRVDSLMQGNVSRLIDALRKEGYYNNLDPLPQDIQALDLYAKEIKAQGGELLFHPEGLDPRAIGGEKAGAVQRIEGIDTLPKGKALMLRAYLKGVWSPAISIKIDN